MTTIISTQFEYTTCNKCEDRKDIDHRICDECDTSYHVDIVLEQYNEDNYIIGSCQCRKYKEYRFCAFCMDHDHIIHATCRQCMDVYHLNLISDSDQPQIVGRCSCGLFDENNNDDDQDEHDHKHDDYDHEYDEHDLILDVGNDITSHESDYE